MKKSPIISIVVPFYNEVEIIDYFYKAITEVITQLPQFNFEIICVVIFPRVSGHRSSRDHAAHSNATGVLY